MSNVKIKAKSERRRKLAEDMGALSGKAVSEGREMTPEERSQFDRMNTEVNTLKNEIDDLTRDERAKALQAEMRAKAENDEKRTKTDNTPNPEKDYEKTFEKWMREGMSRLTAEERNQFQKRALSSTGGSGTEGGYTIPEGFANTIESAMALWGGMREVCEVITTATGNDIPWPTEDDTSNVGEYLAENAPVTEQDVAFGQKLLQAWIATSKMVKVPVSLLNDSFINIQAFLAEKFARRVGTLSNNAFTVGDGANKPRGFLLDCELGRTAAATNVITYDDIVTFLHSVDPVYRRNGRWMFNDNTLLAIRLLKDSENRPLWQPSIQVGEPDTLLGYPITINQDMPDIAATERAMAFGDFSKYKIRVVNQRGMRRLVERYAEFLQEAFFYFERHDGELVNTKAIKHMAMSA